MGLLGIKDEWMPWIAAGLSLPIFYLGGAIATNSLDKYLTLIPTLSAAVVALFTAISQTGINVLTGYILAILLAPPIVSFIAVKLPKDKAFAFIGILIANLVFGVMIGGHTIGIN